ncbi:dTDP-4-amino-4,6-dideoxygalactose transaminase [Microlunatus sagamiharensis]|uniref:dTDP-4-amino-4,6-dideoxygalactose transaminase n=1 Tax=Microlunatus sagamiharensis TaxID=546874 RepID=A0A1H2LTZ5_9ACTN|nr:DegT/DnrJ/EryC1/StrS family aminotransferase [Microlunatus sagamiharensis]SDU84344.1 dTDP-4-amino-4,6-dideoxygalactose transaminase [Microlunatus sagamiharensis]
MSTAVPLVDLAAQQQEIHEEVMAGLADVFATTAFIGGKPVGEFELAYADTTDVAHCVGVANGTDAVELALRGVGVRAGGEVIVPANTFIATAEAISRIGATPVLVDVDPEHLLMDPDLVPAAITSRTQAIVPVHLFGQVAPVERVLAVAGDIPVVEDAAQSQGATRFGRSAGSLAAAAGTSFYPGKNLGAAGDAGAVTTQDAAVAARVRLIANHGSARKYDHEVIGMNSRLDTVQAVVLNAKLRRLPAWNERRREAAARYTSMLADVPGVRVPRSAEGNVDVWHLYVVRVQDRDLVLRRLNESGIGAGIHYPVPLHLTRAYAGLGRGAGAFPVAERAAAEILSLPLHPHLTTDQQDRVVLALREAVRSAPAR